MDHVIKKEPKSRKIKSRNQSNRVQVPGSVAFGLNKMDKVRATVLGQLECEGCDLGHDIIIELGWNFIFDRSLDLV